MVNILLNHSRRYRGQILLFALIIFSPLFSTELPGEEKRGSVGVVVDIASKGGAGERAVLFEGDLLLSWERSANSPANPASASGIFVTPFDSEYVEWEESYRGQVTVHGEREGKPFTVSMSPGEWLLSVRPILSPDLLEKFLEGQKLLAVKESTLEGVATWDSLAAELMKEDRAVEAAWVLSETASDLASAGFDSESFLRLKRALKILEDEKAWDELAQTAYFAGQANQDLDHLDEAKKMFQKAFDAWQKMSSACVSCAEALNRIGTLTRREGDLEKAEEIYLRVLKIREEQTPGSLKVADAFLNLGVVEWSRRDLEGAEFYFAKAAAIRQKILPDGSGTADTLNNLGVVAERRGKIDEAIRYHRSALAIRERLDPDGPAVAMSLNNLATIIWEQGDLGSAEKLQRRSCEIYEKSRPGSRNLAFCLNNLGNIMQDRGDLAAAELYFSRSLEIKRKVLPESMNMASTLLNMGILLRYQGDLDRAEEYIREALAIEEKIAPGSVDVAKTLSNLGTIYTWKGDLENAQSTLLKALKIRKEETPGSAGVAVTLNILGEVADRKQDLELAQSYFEESWRIYEKQAPRSMNGSYTLFNLGDLTRRMGGLKKAESYHMKALEIRETLAPESFAYSESLHALGMIYLVWKKPENALEYYSKAVEVLEMQRLKLGGDDDVQERFSSKSADIYRDLIELLIKLGRHKEAFSRLEQYRARGLLLMLAERDLDWSGKVPPEVIEEQVSINHEIVRVQEELLSVDPLTEKERVAELRKQLGKARDGLVLLKGRIRDLDPDLAALYYPEAVSVEELSHILEPGTLFLSYCTGPRATFLFAANDRGLKVFQLTAGRETLEREIRMLHRLVANPGNDSRALLMNKSRRLYRELLAPAEDLIRSSSHVIICPDGPLHYLPFSILQDDAESYLVEKVSLSYTISATLLNGSSEKGVEQRKGGRIAAFGNPVYPSPGSDSSRSHPWLSRLAQLPASGQEVKAISGLFGGDVLVYLGEKATEENVKQLPPGVSLLHLACHGYVNERFPLESGLVLSIPEDPEEAVENGVLQAWEIFESLRLDADMVTLSACESGLGKEMGGEGLIGLTRAFLYAGAGSVLSTLWKIPDLSTAEFMKGYYGYFRQGASKEEALRLVQLDFIRSAAPAGESDDGAGNSEEVESMNDLSHPVFWGAFVLNGGS